MRKTFILLTALCCTLQMHAQTFGDLYQSRERYEMSDTVYVTRYMNGVPSDTYTVTGDDKLRIMKAVGFIIDGHQPELVNKEDALLRRQPYAYLRNVAPLDKGIVYEIAPFFRYQMLPYRNLTGNMPEQRSHVGGILITGETGDSTVVFGTVARRHEGNVTVFNYPLQYIKAQPAEGHATLVHVQELRRLMKRMYRHESNFLLYGTTWTLKENGTATVRWYRNGVLERQSAISSDRLMPWLNGYLHTLYFDLTGRGYASTVVLPGGYRTGMTADDFTRESYNRYDELIKRDCIEIVLPSEVEYPHVCGLVIQLADKPSRVYGLLNGTLVGAPYLFYTNRTSTNRFNRWLKHNTR